MSPLAKTALCTVAGAVAGSLAGLLLGYMVGTAYVELFNVSSFEGYSGYVMFYCFMVPGIPVGGFLGGLVAGLFAFTGRPWLRRKQSQGEAHRTD